MDNKTKCVINKIVNDTKTVCDLFFESENVKILDKNNISWKKVNSEWLGKRCVAWKDGFAYGWLEDMPKDEKVKYWLHGKEADYNEILKKEPLNFEDCFNE